MGNTRTAALFVGGLPTGPDVRRLMDRFRDKAQGDSILLSDVAAEIATEVRTQRFETVLTAFRAALRKERNLETERDHGGVAVRILQDNERAAVSFKLVRRGARQIGRAYTKASSTPTGKLNEQERKELMHVQRLTEAMANSARQSIKEIAVIWAPPKQLPRATREPNEKQG